MIDTMSFEYKCISAIGNSLQLDKMLTEFITIFMQQTGSIAGIYISDEEIIKIGKKFDIPTLSLKISTDYEIKKNDKNNFSLVIQLKDKEYLAFLFENDCHLKNFGSVLFNLKKKICMAINTCNTIKELHTMNLALQTQITNEKHRNDSNQKMILTQSRMAMMGEMLSMIAHQWRQPITIIGMIANNTILNIELGEINSQLILKDLKLIDKHIHYLSKTIDDFKNFFRPNKIPQRTRVENLYEEIMSILGKTFEKLRITICLEGDIDGHFTTYKSELIQVFLNLFSNAKDAFIENNIISRKIIFDTKINKNNIVFTVQDNAGGISQDVIEHIFEPYFSTKNEKNGTGLGLYMTEIIVREHLSGNIDVVSNTYNTTFIITIPTSIHKEEKNVY